MKENKIELEEMQKKLIIAKLKKDKNLKNIRKDIARILTKINDKK